ncbi:hypothetical protein C8T65DRAFT_652348 [Cerioporus squamosus]|nr:hypothetical protein C8T65DRAFT_652348 [Cerioporus squamosus]
MTCAIVRMSCGYHARPKCLAPHHPRSSQSRERRTGLEPQSRKRRNSTQSHHVRWSVCCPWSQVIRPTS